MDVRTLSEKKNRWIRLSFTRFLTEFYGMNFQTAHGKLHNARIRRWELLGIESCIKAYSPEFTGSLSDFFSQTESKTRFCAYMKSECGMSSKTAFIRFTKFDFTNVELKGFNAIYDHFVSSQRLKP